MKIFEVTENISHTSKRLRDIEQERNVKIGSDEWFKLWFSLPYLKEAKENIYDILEPEDCGPFDGGCVLVAQALQKIHGGEIVVLINDRGNADHAAVKIGNTLLDYDGPLPVEKFIKRFEKNEHVKVTSIRPMEPGDLPEATRNQSLLPKIINLLSKGKSKNVKEASGKESSGHSYLLQLERDSRAGMLVLHILDQKTGKRTEVRGKLGYETNGYDPEDKLHQILDKVGKSASVSDLMNGDVVSINPRHPQGPAALKVAHDLTNESNPFTDARMNAIKAGKTEFTVGGKTYKVTGDTRDEREAVANEKLDEETGKEMLKIFRGMHHDAGMNKDMDRYIQSHDWKLGNFTPDMFPSEEEFFDYDDPFDRVIDIDYSHRVNLSAPIIVGPQFSDGKYSVIDGNHRAATAQKMGKTIQAYFPVEKTTEARTFAPQQTPMQDLVNSYLFFTSFGQMGTSDGAKSSESAEKIKEVIRALSQSHKNLQNLDKQTLEKNKNKILTHIHEMMNYAIAYFKEHLTPDNFQAKRKQINDILTKYNNLASTNENFADGKNPGRKGLAKRSGVNTRASVSDLRKTAKNSSGEKQRMAHWLANMKSGKDK